ncbi:23S rRNA (adenine(2030)-N(6))-methyltransferase RlmJ [Thiomicrorhabdus sp. Kp2]|uniref:23S rRNA (adenine(2030)-N(6))-methyltransferase RlmJ n=1 Tax=Thiomicrorhabdus sp. Kp2 TaxID=1123518 RepID=UPI000418F006|nr:23S rRNA (adenine(2030)-N(6))-methyltransferase RlmJ [Thiomicrorhabdus sp. Kp2]
MLSYLHSFHAGNFADVLKHSISAHILNYLIEKPKPVFYLDTHSGTAAFSLQDNEAQKTQEYLNGIAKLWNLTESEKANLPGLVTEYIDLIKTFNETQALETYPGSPWFAKEILREHDRMSLFELHPREFKTLLQNIRGDRRIKAFQKDGFHACISQLPPKERRGYVLMDPPYEVKQDYKTATQTLIEAHKKFATGTYALWYPVVDRYRIDEIEQDFIKSGIKNIQLFELGIQADKEKGMTSSGMIVINPPWTLMKQAKDALPLLATLLAGKNGRYRCEQLVAE